MDDDASRSPDAVDCPICRRPLRRTADRLISAFECEQCGPFSDFNGGPRHGGRGSDPGRGSGSEPIG